MSTRITGIGFFGACRALTRAFQASATCCLLSTALLAALPLQAVAQTFPVFISVSTEEGGDYPSIKEGDKATFTVSTRGNNSNALTVQYTTTGGGGPQTNVGNATEGTDYTGVSGFHTFPARSSDSLTFDVQTTEDTNYEPWEYFKVVVSGSYLNQDDETVSFDVEREVRISEDDERYVTLSPVSESDLVSHPEFMAKEGGISGGKNELTISLNEPLPYDLHIKYSVGADPHTTAMSGDFTMTGVKTATIKANELFRTIDIGIVDDEIVEPTEYFTLRLLSPQNETQNGAAPTYKQVPFKESEVEGIGRLSVSIMDNDTADMGGVVYLRGEGPSGLGVIDKFPNTRRTLTEGKSTTITAEIAGTAPSSNINIPLKVIGFPSDEVTSADYSIPESITIKSGEKSGSVTLTIKDDSDDERYRELLVVEIDDSTNFPTGYTKGDRNKYEVIMVDNDKTPVSLSGPVLTALTEDSTGTTMATFELRIDRRPKADPAEDPPFAGADADTDEGDATLVLGYTGTATRGRDGDYTSTASTFKISKSPTDLPANCSPQVEAVTCTVTLTVRDDNLYEGGSGTTESVKINLTGSFNDGIKGPKGLSLTIADDDLQPMFSIADVSGPENGNLTFTVMRTGALGNSVSVTADTGNHAGATNSATADTADKDYTRVKGKTLRFSGGKSGSTSKTFEVAITDDNIHEPNETFAVTLSNPVDNLGLPKPAIKSDGKTAVGTIEDNDAAPTALTISVDTDTIAEAADPTTVSVTATITSSTRFATDQTVTVTVGNAENAGEASKGEGGDYAAVDEFTFTIPATAASGKGTFELTPVDDRIDDDGEKISVEGKLGDMTVTHDAITIEDDDTRGITVSKATLTIDEADNPSTMGDKENEGTYEVALASQPEGGTVTINITNPGPTVATVDPPSLTFTSANWGTAQTVTVIAKDDTIDDAGDQKTTIIAHTVSADGTDYAGEKVGDVTVTVLDDDETPTALTITVDTDTDTDDDQNTISEGAATPTVRITATLDGDTQFATDKTITITVGDSDNDTATEGEGGDYDTVNDFNITLPAEAASVSYDLSLTLNSNDGDEPDETVTVTGELAGVTVKGTTITIKDNDPTPTVTLVLTPASINESGATNASTVTATMDGKSSEAVTLTVSTTPVIPAVAGDLTLSENTTLTIPANTQASNGVVTITAVDNDVDAADKTVTVAATATGGNMLVNSPEDETLTITDDDTRGITVSKATLTLDEEDNAATMDAVEHQDSYTVVLDSEPSGGTVTIGVVSGDTNIAGVAPATLTFDASTWNVAQTVAVTAVADGIDNPNDRRTAVISHTVTATGTDYDDATAIGVTITVNDDDGPPTLSINSPSVTEVDGTGTATLTFTVRLAPDSGNTVTVAYADTSTGTATSGGTDYETLDGGTLTFDPSETSKSVAVTVNGDDIDELDETVVLRLSSPSNATLTGGGATLDGTGTINDNDPTPTVSVADASAVSEGKVASPDPPNNMTFTVTLSAVSGLDVTVPYTLGGTATAGTDYTEPDPRSVTIAAGMTQADIAIPVAGDEVDEENETITVTLGTPTNATVSTTEGAGAATGIITDDDTRGVSVTPTALTVAEADNTGTARSREDQETYKVVLTSQPTGAVTVNLNSGDESVARIDTASLVFDTDDWNTERTVTVTGQADVIDNTGDMREVDISHTVSAAGTDYASEIAESVTVTVTDDDAAPSGITLTASPDSVTEDGGAKTITVTAAVNGATRYAEARTVMVSIGGGTAVSGTDYTAVDSFDITVGAGEDDASNTFTLTPENDVLAEGSETIDVTGTLSGVTITPDEITLTDDDAAPSGITLSVDTNGAEDGTPSTVAEDAGATVVTVTASVNGETRYVEAKTVAVSVVDDTAASPADYAAVSNFNITIAAGAASHTGSFTVTPVDDDLDESNETINVTGMLSSVTITPATVTFTDNDDPVSFSIADAEATEGGKVTFMVSREGAEDNVASVKVATATDSGDKVNAADADDYTAIATAQTLNFAKGTTSQTVEVQTTEDDLFEPDETFKAVLSAPALGEDDPGTGVSIEAGKGTAIGTIKNDDTEPSFAVADASASEGSAITFTVTRSGAMDNAVSVKWNTKADSSDGANAASATDYTAVTTATTLTFAKGVSSQTFNVATTEDDLHEGDETFLVELTEAVGGTISTSEATGTINDDDVAPSGITLSVDADTGTNNVQSSIAEEGGVKTVRVTATIDGTTRFSTEQTVTVTVGKDGDSATEGTDYAMVGVQSIKIPIGAASAYVDFMLTPTTDVLSEGSETISVEGELTGVTFTNAVITITDDDAAPSGITLSVDADTGTNNVQSSIAEEGGVKTVRVTATIDGTTRFSTEQTVTVTVGKDGDSATEGTDYAMVGVQSIKIPIGAASAYVDFMLTPTTDVLSEGSETISVEGELTGVTFTNAVITITDDDAAPSGITLSVDADTGTNNVQSSIAEEGGVKTVRVTATIDGTTRFSTEQTVTVTVGKDGDSATEGTDYAMVGVQSIKIPIGAASAYVDFMLTPTTDVLSEGSETISVEGELTGVTFTNAVITINDDDNAPEFITLAVDTNAGGNGTPTSVGEEAGATTVRVTATITSATRFAANQAVTFEVGKSADSATEGTDYTEIGTLTITIDGGEASGYVDFTLTPASDVLDEPNETISVHGTQANITFTDATITITDDDEAPSGITLSVDTNGAEDGTPSTVAEDAGATVVTVTATVNGTTRYVDAKTVAVSVDDDTAASPADYAAVSGFNITIAAGAASHTGSFTVTPVDDDLDEANETIDVTGALTDITITGATVTLTDTDNPVSFSIADAEATEGGKVTFTVSRAGAGDNVASVKVTTATDSGDGADAADADDYTAIATAQTVNFAASVASQTVEVQTTQDDLFEPNETFKANLSAPALGGGDPGTGVSIAAGKGTATGTIKNDDTEPSFAVADASATEGNGITFTVTRSGAMDNAVSVKWNTKADSSDGANAASATDYTPMTTATKLDFAKGVGTQTFTVATTEDVLDEENETFLVELTGAVGATIATAQATGTITDDDAAPSGITLTVSPTTVGEEDGKTKITVTATVNGTTRYVDAQTVTVSVGGGTTISGTDYGAVENFDITIAAGDASKAGTFELTPTDDDLHEGSETIDVTGTSSALTITKASITLEDDDAQPSFAVADASASEGDAITFTVVRSGAMDNAVSVKWNTKADTGAGAAATTDYTAMATATKLDFAKGVGSQTFTVATTEDTLNEANETFLVELTEPVGATLTDAEATGTITNDDAAPTTLTLAVDADNDTDNVQTSLAENGGAKTVKVTATLGGSIQFDVDKTLTLIVGDDDDSATEGTDYTDVANITLTIPAGDQDVEHTFTLTPTDDAFREDTETISFDATLASVTVTDASITLTSEDAAPAITLTVDADNDTDNVQTSLAENGGVKTVRVTATLDGTTRLEAAADLTLAVGKDGDSAVEGTDYTTVDDRTVTIGAGVASVTHDFTLTPTNDALHEGSETISLDGTLTGVAVTDATLTITDDDAAPSGITLSVSPNTVGEGAGETEITVTAAVNGTTRYVDAKTVTVSVGGGTATSATDYGAVENFDITIAAGDASKAGTFELTPTDDDLHEGSETINVTGTSGVTITSATLTLTDDDGQPSFAVADASASEGSAITFTVTRSGAMDNAVSVKWNTKADSSDGANAASATDYTAMATATKLDFAKGVGSQTFTVATTSDSLHEGDETFLVELTEPVGAIISDAQATGTITDDDAAPTALTLSVDADTGTDGTQTSLAEDGGAKTVRVTAMLGGSSTFTEAKTVTLEVGADADSATEETDYAEVTRKSITIDAGSSSGYVDFTLTPTNDALHEGSETISLDGTLTGVAVTDATLTITDDDAAPSGITLSVSPNTVGEGAGETEITVTAAVNGTTRYVDAKTVTVSVGGGTATSATDYGAVENFDITIAAGDASKAGTFELTPTDDDLHEGSETINVTGTSGVTITSATLTLTDDDGQPSFAVADASASEGSAITFTVTRSGAMDNAVSVKWNTKADSSDGANAASATDYTAMATATKLDFAKGVGSQTFTVATTSDSLHEGDETFLVELTEPVGAIISDAQATGTITDDDAAPSGITLSVSPNTVGEGAGETEITVTAAVNGTTRYVDAKTVTVSVGGGTATSATDYGAVENFDITIAAGDASKAGTFELTPTDDDLHEGSETINVTGTSGVTITSATLTLTDDDGQPSFAVADASASEGSAITFTVTRSGAMDNAVSVKWNTKADSSDGANAASATDYTAMATATKLDFAKGVGSQTFTVATTSDSLHEGDETFLVELTEPVGAIISDAQATGTITDDDAAPTALTLSVDADTGTDGTQTSLAEDGGAKTVRVTAMLGGSSTFTEAKTVTLEVGADADSATEETDYAEVTRKSITIDAGSSSGYVDFTLTPTNDALHEGSETISLDGTLTGVAVTDATLTITDDDAAPSGITLSVSPNTVGEGAGETEITVTAAVNGTTRYVDAKTVTVSVGGGTATSATDYGAVENFDITIAAGDASKAGTFELTPTDDDLHEGSETINVTGTSGVTITSATLTLTDDDGQPSFAVADASASEGSAITFTVTRSGAMDNAVSVKWNTKADSSDGANAASATDYTAMATATKLDFAKGVGSQTFTVATTSDSLHEGDETFLVELTEPVGAIISDAQATGTITDDDAAPSGITLSVSPNTVGEGAGETEITVTAAVNGTTRYVDAKTVTVSVGGGTATSATDYGAVENFDITIAAGDASKAGTFELTPTDDDLHEGSETINVTGTSGVTITSATLTLTDDDGQPSFAVADASASEGSAITFTVTRSGAMDNAVSVKWNTKADSSDGANAASATDYTAMATATKLDFAKGVGSQTFTVATTSDSLHEGDETFLVELTEPVGAIISDAQATGTITDDDAAPSGITLSVSPNTVGEGAGETEITVTAAVNGTTRYVDAKTVTVSVGGGTATSATDYGAVENFDITIAAGDASKAGTFELTPTDDDLHEGSETINVTGTSGVTITSATLTLTDDDGQPSFAVADASASEGSAITFTVTRSGAMDNAVSVKWNTKADSSDGANAASATDYTAMATATKLDFAKGVGSQTFTVATTSDSLHEGDETFLVELTEPVGAIISDAQATGTITDDDAAPSGITLSVSPNTVGEGAGETEITVTAAVNGTTRYVDAKTVTVSVGGGTATSATDYGAVENFDITIAAGDASKAGTFELTPTDDDLHEGSETINVTGTSGVTITSATLTLTDDDGQPSFAVADASASEGSAITFTVTRSGAMDNAVSVKWNTKADSSDGANAASATDYTAMATATKLDFAKGVGSQTFTVATTSDSLHEGDETFLVELTEPVGAIISDAQATGTITDDDAAPSGITLSVSPNTVGEGAGETEITVTAAVNGTTRYVDAKTVTVSVGGGTATSATDYGAVENFDITIAAGDASKAGTFELTPTDDDLHEGSETINVTGTSGVTITSATLTLTDDDGTPTVTLVLTPATINESGSTNMSTVTATLSGESSAAVTVTVAAAAGADTVASDFTVSTNKTLTIAAGATTSTGTVMITAVDNDVDAPNKRVTVSAAASGGGVANPTNKTLTITDDEGTPTVNLVLTPSTINESGNGNASTVTATLSGKSSAAVTVEVSVPNDAPVTLSTTTTLTIAAGATTSTGTVMITAVDNDVDAPDMSVTVSATASGAGSGLSNPASQTLTITDDDDVAPTVTLMLAPTTISESGSTNSSTVTATLSGESSAAVTVTVAAAAGAGTAAGDFTVSSNKTLTIAAGAKTSTGAVTITAVDNDVDAPNKSVTVSATASGGGVADPGNQTLTITDDDVAPTGITLSVSPATVGEGDGETEITVTATVNGTTRYVDAKTVTVSVGGGDAISGTDYTAVPSFDIIIAAGEASKAGTFDLTPTDDVVHEGTEMIDVTGASGSLTITKASITLTDDDAAPMALTLSVDADMGTPGIQTSLAEDGGAKKVRVTAMLGGSSTFTEAKTVTLEVGADADSATEGTDYAEVERQSININAGAESGYVEFTLTPTQDVLHEGSEAISLDGTLTGVTVTDSKIMLNDDDGAPTALTLSVDADTGTDGTQTTIAEDGGAKTVRVTATITGETRFVEIKTVTLEVGADADSATEGTDYAEVMRRSITINAGAASGYEEFTLTPTDDTRHEGSETISLAGTLTDVAVTGTSLTITDEEDTPTVTLVLTPATISESGSTNASTVTATLSGESSSAVTVTVAAAAGAGTAAGDFTVSTNKTLTIAAGATTSTGAVTITAVDNNVDAPNKSVTVSATASGGGVASPADQTLTITDDDAAPTGITLSVSPATVGEGDGETEITVTATVNGSTRYVDAKTVTVSVGGGTAISGTDYDAVPSFDITIAAGDASKAGTFDLEPTDDAVHEENETIDVTGSSGVLDITKASIIITDNDDRSDPMLAAWLGRFGRGVAEQALDGIAGRIAASRSAGMQGTVAGKALALGNPGPTPWNFGAGRSFGYAARSDPTISFDADSGSNPSNPVAMTAREVLLGSSFTATGETATGGSLALWGRTAQSSFDGQDGAFSLDGETTSAMLGADYARDGWLLGLALMHSSGKGGYSDSQARPCPAGTAGQSPCGETVRQGGGTVKATMTAVLPYASLQVSERLRLWGALGHGSGEVTLRPEPGGTLSADISWSMAATGLRGDVITAGQGSNFSLAFTSDMLWSRTRSEKTHELAASSATVTRLRAGLEAGWQMPLEHGSWLTPRLEIGARHDGGDAETGLGVELGGGLAWTDPGRGLSLDLSARSLIVHDDDDIKDQGFAAAFNFDPQPDSARGLSLSLRQVAGGQPEGGLNALFTPEPLSARSGASGSSRSAEAAYGLPALSGRFTFTPLVGLSLAEEARDFRVGWRLTPEATAAPDLSIGLVATRRESAAARPVHGVGLGMTFRW